MDILFKDQIEFILRRVSGVKVCLFDDESKQMISNSIPFSTFLNNDFFHFDFIYNKKRTPVSDISCIVILRPSSLKLLIEELVKPFYGCYIILFTNQIDPFALEIVANADVTGSVSEIHELYMDACKQDKFLYTIASSKHSRVVDGLYSLIASLEIDPSIKIYSYNDRNNENQLGLFEIGKELSVKASQHNFKKRGTVLLLKRDFDMITPLVYDWNYQSLIQEHLDIKNGIVKV